MRSSSGVLKWFALLALVPALTLIVYWVQTQVDRDLSAMPAAERRVLYENTERSVRACSSAPASLVEHCQHQADLFLRFPECDDQCRELSRGVLRPSR